MKILSVNCGSSSLKFQMYEMPEKNVLISGRFERISIGNSFYSININGDKKIIDVDLDSHADAVKYLVKELLDNKIVESLDEIKGVGHRIVQGADAFDRTVVIDDAVLDKIDELSALAPLHNPAAIIGIKAFLEYIPNALPTAVFDTAFHQTMDKVEYMYALPMEWYTKYGVRKYGAHGTSHKYITKVMEEYYGENKKLIICHVGNGASITAVKDGKCVDTSMGFTPNAGLIMGSRCGDIDVSIIPYMINQCGLTSRDIDKVINKESGLLGISGYSDFRDVSKGVRANNENCILAYNMYIKRIVDYIAKYYVELGGVDAIMFTAGVLENTPKPRLDIMNKLACLGVIPDCDANEVVGEFKKITSDDSKIDCFVVPTDEELMIAEDTYELVLN